MPRHALSGVFVAEPTPRRRPRLLLPCLALPLFAACSSESSRPDGPHLSIQVAPLALSTIDEVSFTLRVDNADDDLVWEKSGLLSTKYGTGKGDLTYIGPCDADASPNDVTLTIDTLTANGIPLTAADWQNPTPVTLTAPCTENADTPVAFNLTVMRSAVQGFFDIAVNFSDIFCSAKVDCQPTLLHDPATSQRGLTAVFAFACTSGENQKTSLYLDDVRVECGTPVTATYPINPAPAKDGNQGPVVASPPPPAPASPGLFQTAVYWGDEQLPNLEKCYWNQALGLDLAALGPNCRLKAEATAADHVLPGKLTPENTKYPKIAIDVPLTDALGGLACATNPLNGPGSGVTTTYTDFTREHFSYERVCNDKPTTSTLACIGNIPGIPKVTFTEDTAGVTAAAGTFTAQYRLPSGVHFTECCGDFCCSGAK